MSRRGLWGETKVWFVGLVIKNCPPRVFLSRGAARPTLESLTIIWLHRTSR